MMSFKRPNIVRPPSEWKSYFLPLTSSCSNNSCTFFGSYGTKLGVRNIDDVKIEIDALNMYINHGIYLPNIDPIVYKIAPNLKSKWVFLQDGDALVYPYPKLLEVLQYINQKLPNLERIAAYSTPQYILRRSEEELLQLRKQKLSILYVGVESGDDDVLSQVNKGVTHDEIVTACKKAKQADIKLSVTVLLGLGRVKGSEKHSLETCPHS